jgi:hypothetical protein
MILLDCETPSSRLCAFARDNLIVRRALTVMIRVHAKARRGASKIRVLIEDRFELLVLLQHLSLQRR